MNRSLTKAHYAREIADDRTHGAAQLARRCLEMLAEYARDCPADSAAELREETVDLATRLRGSRPAMAPLRNLIDRWMADQRPATADLLDVARIEAAAVAQALSDQSVRAVREIAQHVRRLVGRDQVVFTHSFSSTVSEALTGLGDRGVRVILTESRPLCEGHRLAAQLSAEGIPCATITEAQIGAFIGQADVALVGADTILADGSVVNKSGTLLLALAARRFGVPFHVCCESFKINAEREQPDVLEEKSPLELDAPDLPGVTVRNVYFDVTPPDLVSGWITESGVCEEFRLSPFTIRGPLEGAPCG